MCPVNPNLRLGCPFFDEARVALPGGNAFVVKRQNASAENRYVQQVTLDGQPLKSPFIRYPDIMAGKELVFKMGDQKVVFWK